MVIVSGSNESECDDESEDETSIAVPSFEHVYSSIENLRSFISSRENVPDVIHSSLNLVENFIDREKWFSGTQKKITDYFENKA